MINSTYCIALGLTLLLAGCQGDSGPSVPSQGGFSSSFDTVIDVSDGPVSDGQRSIRDAQDSSSADAAGRPGDPEDAVLDTSSVEHTDATGPEPDAQRRPPTSDVGPIDSASSEAGGSEDEDIDVTQPSEPGCEQDNGGCEQLCSAGPDGVLCACESGFALLADGLSCEDVDECLEGNGGCVHTCINEEGGYQCGCDGGYSLAADGLSCVDIDECTAGTSGCEQLCSNLDGGYSCGCDGGYELSGDGLSCADIDECALGLDDCSELAGCANTPGGYTCGDCPAGFIDSNGDGTTCQAGYNLCGIGRTAPRADGTWQEPIDAPYLPMLDRNSTASAPEDNIDTYDCAPDTLETGPEVIYRFTVEHPGRFVAEVTDGIGTDIDLHLLQNPTVTNGFATGCLGRAHEKLEVTGLGPGTYWLIADSWSNGSTEYVGEYTVAFEWVADEVWREVEVDEGVQWRTLRTLNLGGGDQTINVLEVDPSWDLQPHSHNGCKTVAGQLDGLGAIAGINGGFFNSSCQPLDLLKADGNLVSTNQMTTFTQPTMGWNAGQPPSIVWIDPGADWSNVSNAMGGYPRLVDNGVASAEVKPGESVYSAVDWQKHPRTAVGLTESGTVLMVTIDGRTAAGDGITTPDLAGFMKDLGAVDAMCLDGGGSTTMVVKDCWIGDVVSFPSDNSQADHAGARPVASGLYIR